MEISFHGQAFQGQRSVLWCRNNDYIFLEITRDPRQLSSGRAPIHGQMCPQAWFHPRLSDQQTVSKGKTMRQACCPLHGSTVEVSCDLGLQTLVAFAPLRGDSRSSEPLRVSSISIKEASAGSETSQHLSLSLNVRNPQEETLLPGLKWEAPE